ncbi:MAG: hypothetical protein OXD38_04950 [Aestuariivita sp.]|nr:hypothetical protein [Aestuariivita sp.]
MNGTFPPEVAGLLVSIGRRQASTSKNRILPISSDLRLNVSRVQFTWQGLGSPVGTILRIFVASCEHNVALIFGDCSN